jgi:O-6-methylguanine DNA methyltransferase
MTLPRFCGALRKNARARRNDRRVSFKPNIFKYGWFEHEKLGQVVVVAGSAGVVLLETNITDLDEFCWQQAIRLGGHLVEDNAHTATTLDQIAIYLEGTRMSFNVQLDLSRFTAFQQAVMNATCQIPYGQVLTYGDIARQIGSPRAARAVGGALSVCPISILIPCHRVIGANGRLGGYGSPEGLKTKAWLLQLEARLMEAPSAAIVTDATNHFSRKG